MSKKIFYGDERVYDDVVKGFEAEGCEFWGEEFGEGLFDEGDYLFYLVLIFVLYHQGSYIDGV